MLHGLCLPRIRITNQILLRLQAGTNHEQCRDPRPHEMMLSAHGKSRYRKPLKKVAGTLNATKNTAESAQRESSRNLFQHVIPRL